MASDAEKLMELFAGHGGAHGTHGEPTQVPGSLKWKINSSALTIRESITLDSWVSHLAGKRPLGVIPINEDGKCRWGSIDYDVYDDDLLGIIERAERAKLPLVPCRSKSGGIHLFLFLARWTPAADLIPVLRDMAAHLGLNPAKTDIYPVQQQVLTERGDVGNWIIMPYCGAAGAPGAGTFGGRLKEQYGLKKTGAEMTVGEFIRAAENTMLDALPALKASTKPHLNGHAHRNKAGDTGLSGPASQDFSDGPPCLQHLVSNQILDDGRKRVLFHMAVYYKKSADAWEPELEQANRLYMSPPLPSEEVVGVIQSHKKREYNYTCKTEPMASHCDSAICRFRRHGVGDPGDVPHISGLSVLDTQPPIWFVDVGQHRLEINTDDLQNYQRFQKICMEQMKIMFCPVKQTDWVMAVRAAMDSVVTISAPPEVGDAGRFVEWLEDFCTDRGGGARKEDILRGVAWHDEGRDRYIFQLKSFEEHLRRQKVDLRQLTRGQMTQRIRALGGGTEGQMIKPGTFRSCWWVPGGALSQPPELSPPPKAQEPI